MLEKTVEPIAAEEKSRLEQVKKRGILSRMLGQKTESGPSEDFVDVYQITVEKCFILPDFNDEYPLYLIDTGGTLLILFGQWIYDLIVPESTFEKWKSDESFFQKLRLRCSTKHGIAFGLEAEGEFFVPVQRLTDPIRFTKLSECQFIPRSGKTLQDDLRKAGLVNE